MKQPMENVSLTNPSPGNEETCPVLLVSMPFTLIRWPSLSLGLLKRILVESGINCRVLYGNLLYADQVGLDAFLFAEEGWTRTFLCDWLFQRRVFPRAAYSAEQFVENHLNGKRLPPAKRDRATAIVSELRCRSEAFLDCLVETILACRPRIVGCSLTVVQLFSSLALFQEIKRRAPRIVTLAGGPACEAAPGLALHRHFPQIDFLFSGDADQSITPVCRALLQHGDALTTDTAPPGLITPEHRRTGYPSPAPRVTFDDLDQNPAPDYDEFFHAFEKTQTVKHRLHPAVPFEGSRGCWRGERSLCNFCGDCGVYPTYRTKSGTRLLNELTQLNDRYGATRFVATDNVVNPALFKTFFPKLADPPRGWSLFFEIRSSLKKSEARTLRQAGVTYVQAGIESLHTQSLDAMNKGISSWQNIQCLKWCRQYGISITWFILTRFRGENDSWNEDQASIIPFLAHLQPPRSVGILRPDRHSPYFRDAQPEKTAIRPKPLYACFFDDQQVATHDVVFHLHDANISELLSDPLEHLVRPGRKAVCRTVRSWWKAFMGKTPPVCEMKADQEGVIVTDTRPVAKARDHRLTEPLFRLLRLADSAPEMSELYMLGARQNISADGMEKAIRELIDNHLILNRDGRMISLVLEAPCKELPLERDLPVGWIDGEDRIQAANPLQCDAFWQLI